DMVEPEEVSRERVMAVVRESFKPEFLNRLDEILVFSRLGRDELARVVGVQPGPPPSPPAASPGSCPRPPRPGSPTAATTPPTAPAPCAAWSPWPSATSWPAARWPGSPGEGAPPW